MIINPISMKKSYLILLVACFIGSTCFAQTFVPDGATWYYSDYPYAASGYMKLEKVGTALVEGKTVDLLERSFSGYSYEQKAHYGGVFDTLKVYGENGDVFVYGENGFYTLYKFCGTVGDQWNIPANTGACQEAGVVEIDSVGTIMIDGQNLKFIRAKTISGSWSYEGLLVEQIGGLISFMPFQQCIFDIDNVYGMRCFNSGEILYETGISDSCNQIPSSVFENEILSNKIQLSPNPANVELTIKLENNQHASIKVFAITGELVKTLSSNGINIIRTNIEDLSSGVYTVIVQQNNQIAAQKLIIE